MNKQEMHQIYVKHNKAALITLDVIIIIALILNFFTIFITNALVVKNEPVEPVFTENNPVQSEVGDYQYSSDGLRLMKLVAFQSIWYAIMGTIYIYYRRTITHQYQLMLLCFLVGYLGYMLTSVFFSDFGYLVGSWLR